MLVCPHEILQNQPLGIEGMKVQNNSWRRSRRLLRVAASSNTLIQHARSARQEEIRRIRKKLRLTQTEAARLTGGGPNAFSRYERGETEPVAAVINLLRLLDKHPDLLRELDRGHSQRHSAV
jgi:putative zinc finger/helix-turn-helix YgiT family protein